MAEQVTPTVTHIFELALQRIWYGNSRAAQHIHQVLVIRPEGGLILKEISYMKDDLLIGRIFFENGILK